MKSQNDNVIWAFGTACKIGIQLDQLYTDIAQATIAIQQNNKQNTYAEITCIDDLNQTRIVPSWSLLPNERPLLTQPPKNTVSKDTLETVLQKTINDYNRANVKTCATFASLMLSNMILTLHTTNIYDLKIPNDFRNTNDEIVMLINKLSNPYPIFTQRIKDLSPAQIHDCLENGKLLLIPISKNTSITYNGKQSSITLEAHHCATICMYQNKITLIDVNGAAYLSKSQLETIIKNSQTHDKLKFDTIIGVDTAMLSKDTLPQFLYHLANENSPEITIYNAYLEKEQPNTIIHDLTKNKFPQELTFALNQPNTPPELTLYVYQNYENMVMPNIETIIKPTTPQTAIIYTATDQTQKHAQIATPNDINPKLFDTLFDNDNDMQPEL